MEPNEFGEPYTSDFLTCEDVITWLGISRTIDLLDTESLEGSEHLMAYIAQTMKSDPKQLIAQLSRQCVSMETRIELLQAYAALT